MTKDDDRMMFRLGWGVRAIAATWHCVAGVIIAPLVTPLLRLTAWESTVLISIVAPLGLVGLLVLVPIRERTLNKLKNLYQKHFANEASQEEYREAFSILVNLPRVESTLGLILWLSLAPPIVFGVGYFSDTFSAADGVVVGIAAVAAGIMSQIFSFVSLKTFLGRYRVIMAQGIPDPTLRQSLVRRVPLGVKLTLVVSSLIVVVTFFSVSYSQMRARAAAELNETQGQRLLVNEARNDAIRALQGEEVELEPKPVATYFGQGNFLIVDNETHEIIKGDPEKIMASEIDAMITVLEKSKRKHGKVDGDSSAFKTPNIFSWEELPDGRHVLVVVTSHEEAEREKEGSLYIILVATLSVSLGLAAASRLTTDVQRSLNRLREQVGKITSGDLRRGEILESEDELGDLARGIEQMGIALRDTVSNVATSADRVERTASEIAGLSVEVASASTEQSESVSNVSGAMEMINHHVEEIQGSATQLTTSVEASTSAVADIGVMGAELSHTGDLLSEKVDHVSEAFADMFKEIERVLHSTDLLGRAAIETSSGVKEMAAALSEVNDNAAETLKLSDRVVDSSEAGRETVQKTIRGIGSIQDDSELVGHLVNDLGMQSNEIGSIVGVISGVADETNLLALNAAIIAAQAGEHGRAFSVVADEIKDLADRVMKSAADITSVIQTVQEGSSKTVEAIQRSGQNVEAGVALSQESGTSLELIMESARESGSRMQEVGRAVQEQSAAAEQVSRLMESMREGVEHIQEAAREQNTKTQEVVTSSDAMRKAADQVRLATEEQGGSMSEISGSVDRVRDATEGIIEALWKQSESIQEVARLMSLVSEKTRSNQESTEKMAESVESLTEEAASLREGVGAFKI